MVHAMDSMVDDDAQERSWHKKLEIKFIYLKINLIRALNKTQFWPLEYPIFDNWPQVDLDLNQMN